MYYASLKNNFSLVNLFMDELCLAEWKRSQDEAPSLISSYLFRKTFALKIRETYLVPSKIRISKRMRNDPMAYAKEPTRLKKETLRRQRAT